MLHLFPLFLVVLYCLFNVFFALCVQKVAKSIFFEFLWKEFNEIVHVIYSFQETMGDMFFQSVPRFVFARLRFAVAEAEAEALPLAMALARGSIVLPTPSPPFPF